MTGMTRVPMVTVREFSVLIHRPTPALAQVIRSVVPDAGRERDQLTGNWLIYTSRWLGLGAALDTAGYRIVEVSA